MRISSIEFPPGTYLFLYAAQCTSDSCWRVRAREGVRSVVVTMHS